MKMTNADIMEDTPVKVSTRIHSIDFLRGVVMVLMAIDHTRTFLHSDFHRFNAEDLTQTTPVLFFTRWVTHFCAPVFIFLVGTSAALMLQKTGSKKQVASFLITRGIFLVFLELTLFRICWASPAAFFDPYISLLVIWAIGISMIALALMIFVPYRALLIIGLAILFLHNTLGGISFPEGSGMATFWAFFYSGGYGNIGDIGVSFLYPILPFIGLVALGFCLGKLYMPSFASERRKRILLTFGFAAIGLFLLLRAFNIYGDPRPWSPDRNFIYSVMAFLRTTKYPVSLLYCLMTLGPALIALALIEGVKNKIVRFFVTIGSVPMFYYILHLVFVAAIATAAGHGKYSLLSVYGFFAFQVAILYLLCSWYAPYKARNPGKKWLMYL